MAFLGQLQSKLQEIKMQAMPQVSAVLEQANQATSKARQNLMPMLNKCGQQLDTLGKILQANVNPKQSPIDLLPANTAFDPALEKAVFEFSYDETCQFVLKNEGNGLSIKCPDNDSAHLKVSFLPDEYHLERIDFHWGTEPMNGSEHTVGGVGYAGELHFVHRSVKWPNIGEALKQPDGVLAVAVFFNESLEDNATLAPLDDALARVTFRGAECAMHSLRLSQLMPVEKSKEFWLYDGSETAEPFRETVKWVVCRSAVPISTAQLERLRQLRKSRAEDEVEETMQPIRAVQPLNSRLVRSSFKSVAQAELPEKSE
ncbi:hypothetical protein niasHS_010084 [Heterodera schachtii]|uniref:Carbonic anhydrase n=1 Tax=Heterodera schachtii TaxID=97005 RepID=A0ABD2J473_HETSC